MFIGRWKAPRYEVQVTVRHQCRSESVRSRLPFSSDRVEGEPNAPPEAIITMNTRILMSIRMGVAINPLRGMKKDRKSSSSFLPLCRLFFFCEAGSWALLRNLGRFGLVLPVEWGLFLPLFPVTSEYFFYSFHNQQDCPEESTDCEQMLPRRFPFLGKGCCLSVKGVCWARLPAEISLGVSSIFLSNFDSFEK